MENNAVQNVSIFIILIIIIVIIITDVMNMKTCVVLLYARIEVGFFPGRFLRRAICSHHSLCIGPL